MRGVRREPFIGAASRMRGCSTLCLDVRAMVKCCQDRDDCRKKPKMRVALAVLFPPAIFRHVARLEADR